MAIDSKNIDDFIKAMTQAFGFKSEPAFDLAMQQMLAKSQAQERARQARKQCKNLATINKLLKQLACYTLPQHKTGGPSRTSSSNSKLASTKLPGPK